MWYKNAIILSQSTKLFWYSKLIFIDLNWMQSPFHLSLYIPVGETIDTLIRHRFWISAISIVPTAVFMIYVCTIGRMLHSTSWYNYDQNNAISLAISVTQEPYSTIAVSFWIIYCGKLIEMPSTYVIENSLLSLLYMLLQIDFNV